MNSQIKQFEIVARLPSYLFFLIAITEINEKITLYCHENERSFISSMLNLIGIQTCSPVEEISREIKSLFIINSISKLKDIISIKHNNHYGIIYLTSGIIDKIGQQKIKNFIIEYPYYIIITDIELAISKKRFFINIHQGIPCYKQFENYVLRYRSSYQIQKFDIY